MNNSIIVYHLVKPGTDCPDGICAAWIVSKALNSRQINYQLIGDVYLNEKEYLKDNYILPFDYIDNDIILVDFSYPYLILDGIRKQAKSLTILDHHESRMIDIANLGKHIKGGYSPSDCGATFAWNYFFPDTPQPWFLKYVRQRDIGVDGYYEGEIPHSEAINTAISTRRKGLIGVEAFTVFEQLLDTAEQELIDEGMPFIIERDKLVNEALNQYNGATIQVGKYNVPYYQLVNKEAHQHYSVIGSKAAKKHKEDYEFIAITTHDPLVISLRSVTDNVHLGYLAKSLGGGGHKRAAGYTITKITKD